MQRLPSPDDGLWRQFRSAADPAAACAAGSALTYPVTAKLAQTDNYHGTTVADPYRWLEDANSAETKQWVDAQNAVTQGYLGQIPQREAIRQRLTKLWNYERYSVPVEGRRPLLLQPQRRPAEPVGAVHDEEPGRHAAPAARPEHPGGRRHRRPGRHRSQPGRQAAGLRHRRLRFRLERVEGARHRDRQGPRRPPEVGQVLEDRLDQGRQGLLLQPLRRADRGRPSWPTSTTSRSSTSTRSARRKAPTCWSTSARTKRNGASAPRPPTTAATCLITATKGTAHKYRVFYQGPDASRTRKSCRWSTTSTPPTTSSTTTARPSTSAPTARPRASASSPST